MAGKSRKTTPNCCFGPSDRGEIEKDERGREEGIHLNLFFNFFVFPFFTCFLLLLHSLILLSLILHDDHYDDIHSVRPRKRMVCVSMSVVDDAL